MIALAKKSTAASKRAAEADLVLPITAEWRNKVSAELEAGGRGSHARLARAIGCRTGQLTELLADDPDDGKPNASRYSRYRAKIDAYFKWPAFMPMSPDTDEVRHALDGIANVDLSLLEAIKAMDRDEQRKLAEFIISTRKPKPT